MSKPKVGMDDILQLDVGMNTGSHDELAFNVVKQGVVNIVSMSLLLTSNQLSGIACLGL